MQLTAVAREPSAMSAAAVWCPLQLICTLASINLKSEEK